MQAQPTPKSPPCQEPHRLTLAEGSGATLAGRDEQAAAERACAVLVGVLTPTQRERFERARAVGFLTEPPKGGAGWAWLASCVSRGTPFVLVTVGRPALAGGVRSADLLCNLRPATRRMTAEACAAVSRELRDAAAGMPWTWWGSGGRATLPLDAAERLVRRIVHAGVPKEQTPHRALAGAEGRPCAR